MLKPFPPGWANFTLFVCQYIWEEKLKPNARFYAFKLPSIEDADLPHFLEDMVQDLQEYFYQQDDPNISNYEYFGFIPHKKGLYLVHDLEEFTRNLHEFLEKGGYYNLTGGITPSFVNFHIKLVKKFFQKINPSPLQQQVKLI